jgi:hypothetical protein
MPTLRFSINDAASGALYRETSTNSLDISGNYTIGGATFNIAAGALLTCDDALERLQLKSATMRWTSGNPSIVKITFRRTFTGATGSRLYSVSGDGNFSGITNSAQLSVRGYVAATAIGGLADPSGATPCGVAYMKHCASSNMATWTFVSGTFKKTQNITVPASRELKGTIWVDLASGSLTLSSSRGIRVKFGAPDGQRPKNLGKGKKKEKKSKSLKKKPKKVTGRKKR